MTAPRRHARGRRPAFAADPQSDRIVSIVMALAAEVSVLRDRLDTMERLAERRGFLARGEIESFVVDEKVFAEREKRRSEFLDRILWIVRDELDQAAASSGKSP